MSDDNEAPKASLEAPPETHIFYANFVHVAAGAWDVQIRFGRTIVTDEGSTQKWDVQIIQSPTQAKAFLRVLAGQLMYFEETYGKIPDVLAPQGGEAQKNVQEEDPNSSSIAPEPPSEQSRSTPPTKASRRAPSRPSARPSSPTKRRPS